MENDIKKVINIENNKEVEVFFNTKKLYDYDNNKKIITYIAKECNNEHWVLFIESGTIDAIEDKLKKWNNKLLLQYSIAVNFNSNKNDKDRKIYNNFIKYIKENECKFFTKNGNFRKKFTIDIKDII